VGGGIFVFVSFVFVLVVVVVVGEVEFGCDIWRKPDLGDGWVGAGLTCVA